MSRSNTALIKVLAGAALTTGSVYPGQIALADQDIADDWCRGMIAEPARKGMEPDVRITREGARPIRAEDLVEPDAPSEPAPDPANEPTNGKDGEESGDDEKEILEDGDEPEDAPAKDAPAADTASTEPAKLTKAQRRAAAKAAKKDAPAK